MIHTHVTLKTNGQSLHLPSEETVYSQDDEEDQLIEQALKCLEKRIHYQTEPLDMVIAANYLRLHLAPEQNEVFAMLFLSNQHRVIAFEKLFFGTINTATVHARVIIQRVLAHNAAAAIIAHNHPSGSLEPSAADLYLTQQLKELLKQIDVRLLDHFIVTLDGSLSFSERGLL